MKLAGIALAAVLVVALLSWISGLVFLLFFGLWVVISIIASFYDTPSMVQNGKLYYLSPLLLHEPPKKEVVDIHGGTLFDYYFVIPRSMNGGQRTSFILQQIVEGLIALISKYETDQDQNIRIRGTSYILGKRTMGKFGFRLIKTDPIQKVVLLLNFFPLFIANSIAKNRIAFPRISRVITFEAHMHEVGQHRNKLIELNDRLKSNLVLS